MVSLRTISGRRKPRKVLRNRDAFENKPSIITWRRLSIALLVLVILDQGIAKATARPDLTIREGQQHLHNNLVAHSIAMEDINSDLEFATVRHLYTTHPNSFVHKERRENLARGVEEKSAVFAADSVPPPKKAFAAGFTGVAIRVGAAFAGFIANTICKLVDSLLGKDQSTSQKVGVAACFVLVNIIGIFSAFSGAHSFYKLQQAGTRAQQIADTSNRVMQLQVLNGGGHGRRSRVDVHEMMHDEFHTHNLAVWLAEGGHMYEAAGIMSTIRPVALKSTREDYTHHVWQEFHEGGIKKTHMLTRPNDKHITKRQQGLCEDSDNQAGQDPEAEACTSGGSAGFSGVYDSFNMFKSESHYNSVQYGFGDSKYADQVARSAGDLQFLAGNKSEVCMYPSVNNVTALTMLMAMEFGGKPSLAPRSASTDDLETRMACVLSLQVVPAQTWENFKGIAPTLTVEVVRDSRALRSIDVSRIDDLSAKEMTMVHTGCPWCTYLELNLELEVSCLGRGSNVVIPSFAMPDVLWYPSLRKALAVTKVYYGDLFFIEVHDTITSEWQLLVLHYLSPHQTELHQLTTRDAHPSQPTSLSQGQDRIAACRSLIHDWIAGDEEHLMPSMKPFRVSLDTATNDATPQVQGEHPPQTIFCKIQRHQSFEARIR